MTFLSHHELHGEQNMTTKPMRVVFDAVARTKPGLSFNRIMMTGLERSRIIYFQKY